EIVIGSRQNAQGQTYAVDYIRQQVIAAVGWDRAMNEGFRIRTTIDVDLQKVAEDSIRANLDRVEKHPDYNHHTYAEYAATFRKAKANGTMTARQALAKSKDGAAVRIGMNAGVDSVLQLCSTAGIRSPLRPYPATFLGSSEVTLAELALAYTIFPNGGWRASTPHILERIEEKDGTLVWDAKRSRARQTVIKPETAYEMHSCLVDALQSGTGKTADTQFGLEKVPAAGT